MMAIHYDLVTPFLIKGKVLDKISRQLLSDVHIIFLDTGLDYKRSKQSESFKKIIGKSNEDGMIEIKFDYFWGYIKSIFNKEPKGDFIIRLSKNQYVEKDLLFNLHSLKKDGNYRLVNLNEIDLLPSRPLPRP